MKNWIRWAVHLRSGYHTAIYRDSNFYFCVFAADSSAESTMIENRGACLAKGAKGTKVQNGVCQAQTNTRHGSDSLCLRVFVVNNAMSAA